jgi:hypothetical protein
MSTQRAALNRRDWAVRRAYAASCGWYDDPVVIVANPRGQDLGECPRKDGALCQ